MGTGVTAGSVRGLTGSESDLLQAYVEYLLRVRSVGVETARRRRRYVEGFLRETGICTASGLLNDLTVERVRAFVLAYGRDKGAGACRWMWFSVRSFLRFAWLTGRLSRDLSGGVPALRRRRLDRVPRALSEEQIRALAESIGSDTAGDLRDGAIVCLLATYGVRGCQIRQLCLEDIDWEESRLRFRACKGGRPVDVPLTVEAGNRLCAYVLRARPKSSLREVFLTFTAPFRPIGSSSQLSRVIHRRLDAVGVVTAEGVSRGCHGFRHAFAMRLVGRVPFKHLVDLLGHRDASTTLVYSKVDMGGLAETALPWPEVTP